MHKIFLSHSSKDKSYVSDIAGYFGSDRCVYDSMCFEAGMKNLDEIFREMDKLVFLLFFFQMLLLVLNGFRLSYLLPKNVCIMTIGNYRKYFRLSLIRQLITKIQEYLHF